MKNKKIKLLSSCLITLGTTFGTLFSFIGANTSKSNTSYAIESKNETNSNYLNNDIANEVWEEQVNFSTLNIDANYLISSSAAVQGIVRIQRATIEGKNVCRIVQTSNGTGNNPSATDPVFKNEVVIDETTYELVAICGGAFASSTNLKGKITIPASIKSIGGSAFKDCKALTSLVFENASDKTKETNLSIIGDSAFEGCTGLTSGDTAALSLPSSLKYIGDKAFKACSALNTKIDFNTNIHETLKFIGKNAFDGCTKLSGGLHLPSTIEFIGEYAFNSCSGLNEDLILPANDNFKTISNSTFASCGFNGLLRLPSTVETIDSYAFKGNKFTNVVLSKNLKTIGENAFLSCTAITNEILYIPNDVKTIGDNAFKGCTSIKQLQLGNSVKTIGDSAFEGCTGLSKDLILPNALEKIGDNAFKGCTALGSAGTIRVLQIPKSVTEIGSQAFFNTGFERSDISSTVFYTSPANEQYNQWCLGTINATKVTGSIQIEEGTYGIAGGAFLECTGISAVSFPSDLVTIGKHAFKGCTGLTASNNINIPKSVKSILYQAFIDCGFTDPLPSSNPIYTSETNDKNNQWCLGCKTAACITGTDWSLKDNVYGIAGGAFENCSSLTGAIDLAASQQCMLTYIGDSAFKGCTGFNNSLQLPETLTYLGASAFEDCESLCKMDNSYFTGLPKNITEIKENTFKGCKNLKTESTLSTSIIHSGVRSIGDLAFFGCEKLQWSGLYLDQTVSYIGRQAFYDCKSIGGTIDLFATITEIKPEAFRGCTNVQRVALQRDNLTTIGVGAFSYCTSLETFDLQEAVSKNISVIDDRAFYGCENFRFITIPKHVQYIGEEAFAGCASKQQNSVLEFPSTVREIGPNAFVGVTMEKIIFQTPTVPCLGTNWAPSIGNDGKISVPFKTQYDFFASEAPINEKNYNLIYIEVTEIKINDIPRELRKQTGDAGAAGSLNPSTFTVTLNDGAYNNLEWAINNRNDIPSFIQIDPATGLISWTDDSYEGEWTIDIKVQTPDPQHAHYAVSDSDVNRVTLKITDKTSTNDWWMWIVLPVSTTVPTMVAISVALWIIHHIKKNKNLKAAKK